MKNNPRREEDFHLLSPYVTHCRLRDRYREPHRFYHTFEHVESMVSLFLQSRRRFKDPLAVLMAIYWHDAIYDPLAGDNEDRSASLLRSDLGYYFHDIQLEAAVQLIRCTKDHLIGPARMPLEYRGDARWLMDADLSIFSAPWEQFLDYERGIACEYIPRVGISAYREGRTRFIASLASRRHLYRTYQFRKGELQARTNMRILLLGPPLE